VAAPQPDQTDAPTHEEDAPTDQERPGSRTDAPAPDPEVPAGQILGTVFIEGEVPVRREIGLSTEPACHQEDVATLLTETVIASDGRLQNVFVTLKKGWDADQVPPVPETPVILDQRGCRYEPHVLGVRVGQPLVVRNSDKVVHNVHGHSRYTPMNPTQGPGSPDIEVVFEHREMKTAITCDRHPWMAARLFVEEHPWFTVSGPKGEFTIEGVPPGSYELEAYHEKYGRLKGTAVLDEEHGARVRFTFDVDGKRRSRRR